MASKLERRIDLRGQRTCASWCARVSTRKGYMLGSFIDAYGGSLRTKRGQPANRAGVIMPAESEPAHWEEYSGHFTSFKQKERCQLRELTDVGRMYTSAVAI